MEQTKHGLIRDDDDDEENQFFCSHLLLLAHQTNQTKLDLKSSTAVTMKSTVFWDVMPCSPFEVQRCSSRRLVNFCWTTWHRITEDIPSKSNKNLKI
jgi:hypothetical protein